MLKVRIKNFQSVSDTSFEIDGFTVVVGKNNKGKSAIVRSIDAALSNRLGNNFIKWGKLETQVKLEKDALDITWTKGDSASYVINEKSFTSLKGAVPKPITDAGFRKLEIADEKLNPLVAHQFEELFLINRSGPFVTETLSTLYDLNLINDADTLCQKKLKASKSLLKTRQNDFDLLTGSIDKFKGLDEVKEQFIKLKETQAKINNLRIQIDELDTLYTQLKAQLNLVNKLKETVKIKIPDTKKASGLVSDVQWLVQVTQQHTKLDIIVTDLKEINKLKIPDTKKASGLVSDVQWLVQTIQQYVKLSSVVHDLRGLINLKIPDLNKANNLIQEVQTISKVTEELKILLLSCEKCKKSMSYLKDLPAIVSKLKIVESQVQSYTLLNNLTNEFVLVAQEVKDVKGQHARAKTDLESAKGELTEFKICPLCKNPLTVAHTHE